MPVNLRQDFVCRDDETADLVMFGICAAIDRAFDRGGEAICSAALRRERSGRKSTKPSTSHHLAGWILHGDSVYHHVSAPAILVKRVGRRHVRREGQTPTRVNLWGWRHADDTGVWRGDAPSWMDALRAALADMAASDV
jgi:hypothetical protein